MCHEILSEEFFCEFVQVLPDSLSDIYTSVSEDDSSSEYSSDSDHVNICCCCSLAKSCLTLCNPMDCSTPCFPVPHHLLELAQVVSIESVMLTHWKILYDGKD